MKYKNVANYGLLPTSIIITIALGLYSIIQHSRFFYVPPETNTFNAVNNLRLKIKRQSSLLIKAQKKPNLYQELYIINIVIFLLLGFILAYYLMDWELLIHAIIDIILV